MAALQKTPFIRETISAKLRLWGLTLRVHADAIRMDPRTYFKALAWRVRGLKVRSRNSIAPLLGRSPYAYPLWISRNEGRTYARGQETDTLEFMIMPVIDCRMGETGLGSTLASVAKADAQGQPILIGGSFVAGTRIDHPRELAALVPAAGAWLCPMMPGDQLAPHALGIYSKAIDSGPSSLIYADDDLIMEGVRCFPHFKPQWNSDLFRYHDYLTGASIVHALPQALAELPEEGWSEALVAGSLKSACPPAHLAKMLHHRLARPKPNIPAKPSRPLTGTPPLVSVIIPTRDHLPLLRTCVEGLGECDYPHMEVIVVDNDSRDPKAIDYLAGLESKGVHVLRKPGPFNYSKLNNAAVREAKGDLLCFLNNDVEMIDGAWLALLVRQAVRPEVGAVGAKLLYPDGSIQHAGVFTGIGGGAGHGHRFQRADETGYFERARLPQKVSAVTAACLVVTRDKFLAVGGFDEDDFPVAFNDVDLCLKLNARGWQSFYEPRAELIHHESKSRGSDAAKSNKTRFAGELAALKRKWHTDESSDPYHHPDLSRFSEQFLVGV